MKKLNLITASLLLVAIASPAAAVDLVYTATFSGAAESPPNNSTGHGEVLVTINKDQATMRVQDFVYDLQAQATEAHIHCCTTIPGEGNSVVGIGLKDFWSGITEEYRWWGDYDHTFNLLDASTYDQAFINTHGGTVHGAFDGLLAGIAAGEAYVDIHTNRYLGGEVRGFLSPVPEPGRFALMLAGLGLVGFVARRKGYTQDALRCRDRGRARRLRAPINHSNPRSIVKARVLP